MDGGRRVRIEARERAGPCLPIDREHLARYTLGDRALEAEVLALFGRQAPLYLAELRNAASLAGWRGAAHSLKGSAQAVGAIRVAEAACAAERLSTLPEGEARRAQLGMLESALAEARAFIATLA